MQPFLSVSPDDRARVSGRDDVGELRDLIVAGASPIELAQWLADRDIPVSLFSLPDLDTVEWLYQLGGPEHRANLQRAHSELGMSDDARAAVRRRAARKASRKARRATRRR